MTSKINTVSIDASFPVAGKDNPSQGFRDNFSNIKTGLETAASEISDLQSNTAQLTLANDFSFVGSLERTTFRNTGYTAINAAAITGTIDYTLGSYHKSAISVDTTFQVTNWPASGIFASVRLEVAPIAAPVTINFSVVSGSVIAALNTVLPYTANDIAPTVWDIWTSDGGTSVYVKQVTGSGLFASAAPTTPVGKVGDVPGMYYASPTAIYMCYGAYDGTTNIWTKVAPVVAISSGNWVA